MTRTIVGLGLLAALLASPAGAEPSAWFREMTAHQHRAFGRFTNPDYGFSVAAPPEVAEYVTDGGAADHGVRMIIGERRTIAVYPDHLVLDDGADLPCRRSDFPWERSGSGTVRRAGLIGGYRACAVTYAHRGTVWHAVQARGTGRARDMKYTLLLTTTARHARADLAILRRVATSFRREPIVP